MDPVAAEELEALAYWCRDSGGGDAGALEAFLAAGGRCCGAVPLQDLATGLQSLDCPQRLMKALSLLDPWQRGSVCAQDFFAVEQDPARRRALDQRWQALAAPREKGVDADSTNGEISGAQQLLYNLAKQSTPLGGRHWKACKTLSEPTLAFENKLLQAPPVVLHSSQRSRTSRVVMPRLKPDAHAGTSCPDLQDAPEAPQTNQVFRRRQTRSVYEQKQFVYSQRAGMLPTLKTACATVPYWGDEKRQRSDKQRPRVHKVLALGRDQLLFENFERSRQGQ